MYPKAMSAKNILLVVTLQSLVHHALPEHPEGRKVDTLDTLSKSHRLEFKARSKFGDVSGHPKSVHDQPHIEPAERLPDPVVGGYFMECEPAHFHFRGQPAWLIKQESNVSGASWHIV